MILVKLERKLVNIILKNLSNFEKKIAFLTGV